MKINEYKTLKAQLLRAKDNDFIWWEGYLFLDLTTRQCDDLYDALYSRFGKNDKVVFPSGLSIKRS